MLPFCMSEPEDLSVTNSSLFSELEPRVLQPQYNVNLQFAFFSLLEQCKQQFQSQPRVLPSSQEFESVIRKAIVDCLLTKNCKLTLQGEIKITVDSAKPLTVKFGSNTTAILPISSPSASKRKSYQPVRILPANGSNSPNCHSPDSGALDLSRAASVVSGESAPSTPFKMETVMGERYEYHASPNKMPTTRKRSSGGRRTFSCNQCNEMEFRSLQHLETHTLEVHGAYRCHVCQAKFTQRSNLQRHALKHVGFKPFQCRLCGHGYYRKDHLMRHMEVLHPSFSAHENIEIFLTSSQSLDYLNGSQVYDSSLSEQEQEQQLQVNGSKITSFLH